MTTQKLKEYIDRVLGNSIRCLLPSYWWKRLFGLVVDKVESVEVKANTLADGYKELEKTKANAQKFIAGRFTELDKMEYDAVYMVVGTRGDSLKVNFWEYLTPHPEVVTNIIWFTRKTKLEVVSDSTIHWQGIPTIDLNNLNEDSLYKLELKIVSQELGNNIRFAAICANISEYSSDKEKYDTAISDYSTNAVQNKVIKQYVDEKIANLDLPEGGITVESDPIFSASPAAGIKSTDITNWNNKVDKVSGKQLSTEDFTTALKNKLNGLSNYDDTQLENAINTLRSDFDKLVNGDTTTAIKTFNEVIAFLNGISDTESLDSIIASIEQQISAKQDALVSGTNIKTVNGESILGEGNLEVGVDTSTLATKEELAALRDSVMENEEVTAAALTDLDKRLINQIADVKKDYTEKINTLSEGLNSIIIENEEITAAALTDLNKKVDDILYLINSQNK